jgi:hypothetical protein
MMRHYLVIANRTLNGRALERWVTEQLQRGPLHLHLLVPVTRVEGRVHWDDVEADANARRRLHSARAEFRARGALVCGEVTRADPVTSAVRTIDQCPFSGVVVSTLPGPASEWLRRGVVDDLRQMLDVPVLHLADDVAAAAA